MASILPAHLGLLDSSDSLFFNTSTLILIMTNASCTTLIGFNEIGFFIGEGDCQIQFTQEQMDALIFAQIHAKALGDAFANFCKMTFASGSIPSCFRQDLSSEEVADILKRLPAFQESLPEALFNVMLISQF